MNTWDQIKAHLSSKISFEAYQNWLSKTFYLSSERGKLCVAVPDRVTKDWIEQEYTAQITAIVRELRLPVSEVIYELRDGSQGTPSKPAGEEKSDIIFAPSVSLNPKYTFDNFVVGSCNQF